jgi:hypothetical protein
LYSCEKRQLLLLKFNLENAALFSFRVCIRERCPILEHTNSFNYYWL